MLAALRAGRWSGYIRADLDLPTLADRICQSDAARRARRHSAQCRCRSGGRGPVPDPAARARQPTARRCGAGSLERPARGEPGHRDVEQPERSRSRRQGRPRSLRRASRVRSQGIRSHDRPRHRVRGRPRHRHRLPADRVQGGAPRVDHALVRQRRSQPDGLPRFARMRRRSRSWTRSAGSTSMRWTSSRTSSRSSSPGCDNRRRIPPTRGGAFTTRLRQLQALLTEGIRSGEIRIDSPSTGMLARCVLDVLWIPENILRAAGRRAALIHARDTVLRGVAERGN